MAGWVEFRDFVDERARHIRHLIIEYAKRLQILELRQAQMGLNTPPEILLEIQDIRTAIEQLRRQIRDADVRTDYLTRPFMEIE